MITTPSPAAVEPNNAVAAAADERLKHAYQQIASADEQLARLTQKLSKLELDAARQTSAVPSRRQPRGNPALRGGAGLLLAACIVGAAFVSQSSSGDATKQIIARWIPSVLASSVPLEKSALPISSVQVAAAESTAVPASSPAPGAPQESASTTAPLPPELAQLLQTITQDIANVDQKIDQLKAAQEQVASNNAKAIEELKASQEEMTRLMAKASEPNSHPKSPSVSAASVSPSAASARPAAVAPRQPTSTHASSQARSLPPAVTLSPRDER